MQGTLLAPSDISQSFFAHLDRNIPAVCIVTVVGALSTAAGAGGGALFVPLFKSLLEFSVKDSAATSQAIITGGAIAGASFALFQTHPQHPDKSLIQFDLALLLIPSLLLGTSIGVILNHMIPVWLITIGLVCLLSYLTCKTAAKGLRLYRIECKPPAGSRELHLVQIHEQDAERANSIHNLLRSVSEDSNIPGSRAASTASAMAADYEATRPDSSLRAAKLKAVSTSQELTLAMPLASHADDIADINWDLKMDKTTGEVPFQPSVTDTSAQSLRIRAESDSEPFTPFTPDASQTKLGLEPSPRQHTRSSSGEFGALQASSSQSADDAVPLLSHDTDHGNSLHGRGITTDKGPLTTWSLQQLTKVETSILRWSEQCTVALERLPVRKLLAALAMWLVFAVFQLTKGQTRQCSTAYWVLYTLQAVLLLGASAFFVHIACRDQQSIAGGSVTASVQQYQQQQQQTQWSHTTLMGASAVGVCGGALAAILGMGGGIVMGPLLLTLQVHPLATAATSTLMILFSSSAATLSFAVDGNINAQYACIYGSCNFLSSFAGVFIIGRIVRKTGKSFVVVMLLAWVLATGAMASAVFGGQESVHDYRSGTNLTFSSMCTIGR
ncbi:TPA: hypothetical protein ACH3X1_013651 [Trebouxia sp. C0004]